MELDLTVTVSVIIALCAIVSPILVAIINNRHQRKMKQLEIAKEHKMKAFETYLCNLEIYIRKILRSNCKFTDPDFQRKANS